MQSCTTNCVPYMRSTCILINTEASCITHFLQFTELLSGPKTMEGRGHPAGPLKGASSPTGSLISPPSVVPMSPTPKGP